MLNYGGLVATRDDSTSKTQPAGKGRPTRSRKEAEAARKQPLVGGDRKQAKKLERERRNELYARQQEALQTGDERYLPERDKGRVKRFVRDFVDARWSFSEFLLPMMLLFLVASLAMGFFGGNQELASRVMVGITIMLYGFFFLSILEGVWVWQRLKRLIKRKYPNDVIPRATWFYMYARMIMARRWRSPKPQVVRGDYPQVPDRDR